VSPTISDPIVIILELLWPLVIYPERSSDTSAAIMPLIQEVDFVDATLAVAKDVQSQEGNLGIVIDAFGAGSFMVATKIKGMIAAEDKVNFLSFCYVNNVIFIV
jgi:UDP-N-acetylglucosamine pyrophosphorylase